MMTPKDKVKVDIEAMLTAYYNDDFHKVRTLAESIKDRAADIAYESVFAKEFQDDKKKVEAGGSTAHSTHCCLDHGCKYGDDEYCTVMQGIERQDIMCPVSTQCDTYGDYDEEYDMHSNYKPY